MNRENKRYFYVNTRTQHSQWTFPSDMAMSSSVHSKSMWNAATNMAPAFQASGAQFPLVSSSMSEEQACKNAADASSKFLMKQESSQSIEAKEHYPAASASWMCSSVHPASSPPPPPPGVDSPPPPLPPKTPPLKSPPPPPPDSTEIGSEIRDVDMDLEDSNSSDSFTFSRDFVATSKTSQPSRIPLQQLLFECSSNRSPERHTKMLSTSIVSSTSLSSGESAVIAKPPQPISALSSSSEAICADTAPLSQTSPVWSSTSSLPSCSSSHNQLSCAASDVLSVQGTSASAEAGQSSQVGNNVVPSSSAGSQKSTANNTLSTTTKKKKPKLLSGLAFKKKNMPSLVQKWQKIKAEQEKEDKIPDDPKIST